MNLSEKTAIVTGGAVRLGRALALALAQEGANVVVHYNRSEVAAVEVVDEIVAAGGKAIGVQANLTSAEFAANSVMNAARENFGGADILINNAAIFEAATLAETTSDLWDRHFNINVKAACFLCREFAAQFDANEKRDGDAGHIINIADWRAERPTTTHLAYSLTKSALVMLTRISAMELAPRIRVNAVAPGSVLPPPGATAETLEAMAKRNLLGRLGCERDITDAVLYLLQSEFVTGEILHVAAGEQL